MEREEEKADERQRVYWLGQRSGMGDWTAGWGREVVERPQILEEEEIRWGPRSVRGQDAEGCGELGPSEDVIWELAPREG